MSGKPIEIPCGACGRPLQMPDGSSLIDVKCAFCSQSHLLELFPAFWRDSAEDSQGKPRRIVTPDQASCFFHASNEAASVCGGCGRFICELCQVDFQGSMLCPACIQAGFRKGNYTHLDKKRFLYDEIALFLALLPIVFLPLAILTAPAAVIFAIRFWRAPLGLVKRSRIRFVLALILSLAQIGVLAVWVFAFLYSADAVDFF